MPKLRIFLTMLATVLLPAVAFAAEGGHGLPSDLGIIWVLPFACMLLSIALGPLVFAHIWHHHYGKIALFWGLAFLVPCAMVYGASTATYVALHTILLEYIPFIILLLALFTVAGGIRLKGSLVGTPVVNTGILLVGTVLASLMGTTGAAMLLIRPMLRANKHRKYQVHQVIFFIFLVANIGGSLSPLGDPPLFLGFLKGVDFFWTTVHLFVKTVLTASILLVVFFLLDSVLYAKEGRPVPPIDVTAPTEKLGLDGTVNIPLLLCIVALVLGSGLIKIGDGLVVYGVHMDIQNMVRDISLLCVAGISIAITSKSCRQLNNFTWEPILEVGKLFIGIFLSMIPAIAILQAGTDGALGGVVRMVTEANGDPNNHMYFWLTGILSSFLDNAPTYLVFFNTAGGDALHLMNDIPNTLAAISAGAVFMGAVTYIGNAPNFMVRSIAADQGVPMPSFFGYMVWSIGFLYPIFILLTFLFF